MARVARGWAPTPTGTREGPRVLGYAACLAEKPAQNGEREGDAPG
jgi:hypothetical protein